MYLMFKIQENTLGTYIYILYRIDLILYTRVRKSKTHLKPLGTTIHQNFQFYYPSEPFNFHHFNVRHPVEQLEFKLEKNGIQKRAGKVRKRNFHENPKNNYLSRTRRLPGCAKPVRASLRSPNGNCSHFPHMTRSISLKNRKKYYRT